MTAAEEQSPVRRTRTVAVRLTAAEQEQWRTQAQAEGRRELGTWIRAHAVAGYLAGRGPRGVSGAAVEVAGEVAGLRQQLARVGNNVNQLARAANQDQEVDPGELSQAVAALGRIADAAERIERGEPVEPGEPGEGVGGGRG